MKLRTSIQRKESRRMLYREDYPVRDGNNFLAWIHAFEGEDETMQLKKVPIPDDWKPASEPPYEERYLYRFPGEREHSANTDQ